MSISNENRPEWQVFYLSERRISQQKWMLVLLWPAAGVTYFFTDVGLSIGHGETWQGGSYLVPYSIFWMVIMPALSWWLIPVSFGSIRLHLGPDVLRIESMTRQLKEVKLGEVTEVILHKSPGDVVVVLQLRSSRGRVKLYGWQRMNDLAASVISCIQAPSVEIREVPARREFIFSPEVLAVLFVVWSFPFIGFAMTIWLDGLDLILAFLAVAGIMQLGFGLVVLLEWRTSGRVPWLPVAIFLGLILLSVLKIVVILQCIRLGIFASVLAPGIQDPGRPAPQRANCYSSVIQLAGPVNPANSAMNPASPLPKSARICHTAYAADRGQCRCRTQHP